MLPRADSGCLGAADMKQKGAWLKLRSGRFSMRRQSSLPLDRTFKQGPAAMPLVRFLLQ